MCLETKYGQSFSRHTAHKMEFSNNDFFSKCNQILHGKLQFLNSFIDHHFRGFFSQEIYSYHSRNTSFLFSHDNMEN